MQRKGPESYPTDRRRVQLDNRVGEAAPVLAVPARREPCGCVRSRRTEMPSKLTSRAQRGASVSPPAPLGRSRHLPCSSFHPPADTRKLPPPLLASTVTSSTRSSSHPLTRFRPRRRFTSLPSQTLTRSASSSIARSRSARLSMPRASSSDSTRTDRHSERIFLTLSSPERLRLLPSHTPDRWPPPKAVRLKT